MVIVAIVHWTCWLLVVGSAAYLMLAIASVAAFRSRPDSPTVRAQTVTVMRPLCGWERGLEEGLESLLSQAVDNRLVRFVFGVTSVADPALSVARQVADRFPDRRVQFAVNPTVHGTNPKVSNLINMSVDGLEELVVITDSDVVLPPGSLQRLIDAAEPAHVGAVTALSRGRPGEALSRSQRFGALYLDGWFLPTALLHARLGEASVCYGQLTAIKREVLPGGGFEALADVLADDTELGHFARRAGRSIRFAPDVVEAWVNDTDLTALFTHELRWARTIRALQPVGYVASIFMHPGPLPLCLVAMQPTIATASAAVGLVALRWLLVTLTHARLGRAAELKHADPISLWLRDQIYFGVWVSGFFGNKIAWRGRQLWVGPAATVSVWPPNQSGSISPAGRGYTAGTTALGPSALSPGLSIEEPPSQYETAPGALTPSHLE